MATLSSVGSMPGLKDSSLPFPQHAPPHFNAKFHQHRRAHLAHMMPPNSAAIIIGGLWQTRNGDNLHPYRPGNNLFYFSGFEEEESIGIIKKSATGEHTFMLIVPPKDPTKEVWSGSRAGIEGAKKEFFADEAEETTNLECTLGKVKESVKQIFLIPSDVNNDLNEKVSKIIVNTINWGSVVSQMRLVKTEEEIAIIGRAIEITAEGYKKIMRCWVPGTNEGELQAIHECEIRKLGAVRLAFPTIVAAGKSATTLHYLRNSASINSNDLILVDSGAEYGNYSSDITRTWPNSGRFSKEQRELYDIVYQAQQAVFQILQPGVCLNDLQAESERVIERGLRDLGLLSMNSTREELKLYYPHGIGHHIGLDVHDAHDGAIVYQDLKQQGFRPNMVITVEPGVYIPENANVDDMWKNIGIRIEDDVLITREGYINLSEIIPSHPDEIEKLLSSVDYI